MSNPQRLNQPVSNQTRSGSATMNTSNEVSSIQDIFIFAKKH
ncbi:hypothetical protein SEHO0A_00848 [Salmonella enterica subsp. houtenae str. ATCC BAA-1581]|nr:hypothetical protein SEHO0A_00848 [Salmonella enterica subsp. houtenae str. ATCC BAA-1581]